MPIFSATANRRSSRPGGGDELQTGRQPADHAGRHAERRQAEHVPRAGQRQYRRPDADGRAVDLSGPCSDGRCDQWCGRQCQYVVAGQQRRHLLLETVTDAERTYVLPPRDITRQFETVEDWDFPGGRSGGNQDLVLGLGSGEPADLDVPRDRDELIAYGPLLSDDGTAWLGTAVLVRARDADTARAVLTPDRYADIEVHDWEFGGRR